MNTMIEQMLKSYNTQTLYDKKNAMKEVMQELVLCGLSRAGFFKKAAFEHKYRLLPVPYEIKLYDVPSLFAGKIHAVICRGWKNRVKGRDLYDYVFFLAHKFKVNQRHLRERLLQSGNITEDLTCSLDEIKQMLHDRFDNIDYEQAKNDVEPFIRNTSVLDVWSADFFKQITDGL